MAADEFGSRASSRRADVPIQLTASRGKRQWGFAAEPVMVNEHGSANPVFVGAARTERRARVRRMSQALAQELSAELARLESVWRAEYPGYVDVLAGPLDEAGFAALAEWFGDVPVELRGWFGWHNGSAAIGSNMAYLGATLGLQFINALEAREEYVSQRAIADEMLGDGYPVVWGAKWFPLLTGEDGSTIAIDFTSESGPHPLHHVGYDGQITTTIAPSLLDVVRWWIELHQANVYVLRFGVWDRMDSEPIARRYPELI
jgi:cell wall assembly regulator SMI1